jgi:hypothetical protein
MLEHLQPLAILGTFVRLMIISALVAGLMLGLQRSRLESRAQIAAALWILVPMFVWLALVWELALAGVFRAQLGLRVPALPLAIFLPVLVGLVLLTRSQRMAMLLDAVPPWWLIGLQVYRIFGGIFLVRWAAGDAPGVWAIPAGTGDVLVGLLALPAALYFRSGRRGGRAAAYAWNVFGVADLLLAVALGAMTSPGPLQMLSLDRPNILVGAYPTVMVPAYGVPLSLILHGLSIWQLRRRARHPVAATA